MRITTHWMIVAAFLATGSGAARASVEHAKPVSAVAFVDALASDIESIDVKRPGAMRSIPRFPINIASLPSMMKEARQLRDAPAETIKKLENRLAKLRKDVELLKKNKPGKNRSEDKHKRKEEKRKAREAKKKTGEDKRREKKRRKAEKKKQRDERRRQGGRRGPKGRGSMILHRTESYAVAPQPQAAGLDGDRKISKMIEKKKKRARKNLAKILANGLKKVDVKHGVLVKFFRKKGGSLQKLISPLNKWVDQAKSAMREAYSSALNGVNSVK